MHDYTATGPALGRKLKLIGGLAEQGFLPAEYGRRITAFLDTIEERKRLHDAYRALANLLDPESDRPWATAEKIYQQLEAFEKTPGYLRISRGYRQPKTTTEKWLVDALPLRGVRTIYRALTTDI